MKLTPVAIALLLGLPWGSPAPAAPVALAPAVSPHLLAQAGSTDLDLQGRRQLDAGDFTGAIASFEQALSQAEATGDEDAYSDAFIGLAQATLLAQDYTRTMPMWQRIVSATQTEGYNAAGPLTNLALAFYNTQQYAPAEQALRAAIAGWETLRADSDDLRQVTLFEQQAHSYRLLQKVLVAQGKTEAALVVAEASRGQALVEQLVQQYSATENQPRTAVPDLTLAQIRQTAREQNTTIVLYSLVGDEVRVLGTEANRPNQLFTWVVQPDGQIHFRSADLAASGIESLRHFVHRTRHEAIRRRSRGQNVNASLPGETFSAQMYQLLIAPIAPLLPRDPQAHVTLVPQDALFLIPFAALKDLNGTYLIEQHTLVSAPSVQVLRLTDDADSGLNAGPASLIIGNPAMPTLPGQTAPLIDLPGAETEAKEIAALLNTQPLLGPAASEAQVRGAIAAAPIIHFATHGLLDLDSQLNAYGEPVVDDQPTARESNVFITPGAVTISGNVTINGVPAQVAASREKVYVVELAGALALTPTRETDGFLTSREIAQLDLAADLVVLSACDTGQGRITGDGVVGLARSFMAAGADTVVVSLWSIPDAPTAELMVHFYQQLAAHGDKARALREAMLATQAAYPHPMNWAGFTLVGSPL